MCEPVMGHQTLIVVCRSVRLCASLSGRRITLYNWRAKSSRKFQGLCATRRRIR